VHFTFTILKGQKYKAINITANSCLKLDEVMADWREEHDNCKPMGKTHYCQITAVLPIVGLNTQSYRMG
jgi:hypothetical protein